MEYLARKINKAKWATIPGFPSDAIGADAVAGGCFRTSGNSLSVWRCSGGEKLDSEPVVLAMAAAGQYLEGMAVIVYQRNYLSEAGFSLRMTPGNTPVMDLRTLHVDIGGLDMDALCRLARQTALQARQEFQCYSFTKSDVRRILADAVRQNRLPLDDLEDRVREGVRAVL